MIRKVLDISQRLKAQDLTYLSSLSSFINHLMTMFCGWYILKSILAIPAQVLIDQFINEIWMKLLIGTKLRTVTVATSVLNEAGELKTSDPCLVIDVPAHSEVNFGHSNPGAN